MMQRAWIAGVLLLFLAGGACGAPPAVAAGLQHGLAVSSSGSVLAWGSDSEGQLGQNRLIQRDAPVAVAGLPTMTSLTRGSRHYIGVARDGRVLSWGSNDSGQLGDGSRLNSSAPVPAVGVQGATAVSGGWTHSLAVTADGSVWAWGLGGSVGNSAVPTRVDGLSPVVSVAAGSNFSLALKADGTVWAWGQNNSGQLGDGTRTPRSAPVQVQGLRNITAVTASFELGLALDRDGMLWSWGRNDLAQVGDDSRVDRLVPSRVAALEGVVAMSADLYVVVAVRSDGTAWTWGAVDQAADGSYITRGAPQPVLGLPPLASVSAGGMHLGLARDGRVVRFTSRSWEAIFGSQISGAVRVTTSPLNGGAVVMQDGSVRTWGSNEYGQLGDGGVDSRPVPTPVAGLPGAVAVAAGYAHSLALAADGSVHGWGRNNSNELGDGSYRSRSTPGRVDGLPVITAIAAGESHSLALDPSGRLWAWGYNADGQIGDGASGAAYQPVPKRVEGIPAASAIAGGQRHTLALAADGSVWAWGANGAGQLGTGTTASSRVPVQVPGLTAVRAIAARWDTSLALTQGGTVFAWGNASGFGKAGVQTTPTRIADLAGAQGLALDGFGASAFVIGSGGTPVAWGANASGVLGDGSYAARLSPAPIAGLGNVKAISAGLGFALALEADGSLRTWGSNASGQLGDGTLATAALPGFAVAPGADRLLDLDPAQPKNALTQLLPFFVTARRGGNELQTALTDLRATGVRGEVYFSALVPADSPLRRATGPAAGPRAVRPVAEPAAATVPVVLSRGGFKQTGPTEAATPAFEGPLTSGAQFAAYSGLAGDPLAGSSAIVCMGVTVPELSAKGQVLMRPVANGDSLKGVTQCPTVQTPATLQLYRGTAAGGISNLTLSATITPQPEDRGKVRQVFMWAVAPDGAQYMQTGDNLWETMREPMVPLATLTVPASGDITVVAVRGVDLTRFAGTLVYVGLGASWTEVKQLNKAGHYHTVQ